MLPQPVSSRPQFFSQPGDQVIDLTNSPSPPSSPRPHLPIFDSLLNDLPPKTPVCIGQLVVTALILYPLPYIQSQESTLPDADWVTVHLQYEHNPHTPSTLDTIHIKTPHNKSAFEDECGGEAFGVVEQKVASHLGPMLGKGLIRLDAKMRRSSGNVSTAESSEVVGD